MRTVVPSAWGAGVATVLAWAPPLLPGEVGDALDTALNADPVLGLLVTASIAGWYALARRVELWPPGWLRRLVLGSQASPSYEYDDATG